MMITIKVLDKNGNTKFVEHGREEVCLVATSAYELGDRLVVEINEPTYAFVQLDEALGRPLMYMESNLDFDIPFEEKRICYPPNAFLGNRHLLYVKKAKEWEIASYRNLAFNPNDSHKDCKCYPHTYANVETRGESVFASRNAIDGVVANHSHGEWPYASWGINQDPEAMFTLDFGREVLINKIVIYERADFPHDNWWEKITVEFSDGEERVLELVKTDGGQAFEIPEKKIKWLRLKNLIKADDPSPFPALTQIEVYGRG